MCTTKDEMKYAWDGCLANMKPSDTVIFCCVRDYERYNMLSVMNNAEISTQAKIWRKQIRAGDVECHDYNNRETTIDSKTYYSLVIQSKNYEGFDLLGLFMGGIMVSGFIYYFKSKQNRDTIFKFIKIEKKIEKN